MHRIEFTTTEYGWVTSNTKQTKTPASITKCKKCDYELKAILPSELWNRYWNANHNCKDRQANRQAFDNMLGNPMDTLSGLGIR